MGRNLIETVMGAVVLLVAGGFLAFAYNSSNMKPVQGYGLKAKFESVGGVSSGSDVRIGGIKIGVVSALELDAKTYQAVLTFQIKDGVEIPADSTASIVGDGLLGGKYVAIEPGGDDRMLGSGGEIKFTQSSVSLETLIGKMIYSGGGEKEKAQADVPAPAPVHEAPAVQDAPKPDDAPATVPTIE